MPKHRTGAGLPEGTRIPFVAPLPPPASRGCSASSLLPLRVPPIRQPQPPGKQKLVWPPYLDQLTAFVGFTEFRLVVADR
jgi:hypothetical protein